ncbi:MAG TPA: hypothetical protein VGF17_21960 [Phytomonospora sp.]
MKLIDKVLDRLVGRTRAHAACPPEDTYPCVISGVCPGLHTRKHCYTKPDCSARVCVVTGCC